MDDLRSDSSALVTFQSPTSPTSQNATLHNQGQPSWDPNSTHVRVSAFSPPSGSGPGSVTTTLISNNSGSEGNDSWFLQAIDLKLRAPNGSRVCEQSGNGSPLAVVTDGKPFDFATPNCSCGDFNQPCCANGPQCKTSLACETVGTGSNICSCGNQNQPCCQPGSTCTPGLQCDINSQCTCGGLNQVCCNQGQQCNAGLICSGGFKCISTCGNKGQPCCSGSCSGFLTCVSGQCTCGGLNEFCCVPGGTCDFGLACANSICHPSSSSCPQCNEKLTLCLAKCGNQDTQCQCMCRNSQCSCFQSNTCGQCSFQNCTSP